MLQYHFDDGYRYGDTEAEPTLTLCTNHEILRESLNISLGEIDSLDWPAVMRVLGEACGARNIALVENSTFCDWNGGRLVQHGSDRLPDDIDAALDGANEILEASASALRNN
jgi:hypothetical protein